MTSWYRCQYGILPERHTPTGSIRRRIKHILEEYILKHIVVCLMGPILTVYISYYKWDDPYRVERVVTHRIKAFVLSFNWFFIFFSDSSRFIGIFFFLSSLVDYPQQRIVSSSGCICLFSLPESTGSHFNFAWLIYHNLLPQHCSGQVL